MDLPAREAWTDRLPSYASAAQAALPEAAPRIAALRDLILTELTVTDRGPVVPAHGDFYEANMLMQGGTVSCLLDVDALGPGHRVDDLACFLGHLAVLPAVDPRYVHVPWPLIGSLASSRRTSTREPAGALGLSGAVAGGRGAGHPAQRLEGAGGAPAALR
ncbi:phosphotransferase [Nesterenkonia pannonica]|uniref:phosphotransferase n=1 Tax=Nesterenkonia pannonica TaxID=1548602 RepID=UPI0021646619|nr:phosphotransferase [Nesterenkonia pannonica]